MCGRCLKEGFCFDITETIKKKKKSRSKAKLEPTIQENKVSSQSEDKKLEFKYLSFNKSLELVDTREILQSCGLALDLKYLNLLLLRRDRVYLNPPDILLICINQNIPPDLSWVTQSFAYLTSNFNGQIFVSELHRGLSIFDQNIMIELRQCIERIRKLFQYQYSILGPSVNHSKGWILDLCEGLDPSTPREQHISFESGDSWSIYHMSSGNIKEVMPFA